MNPSSRPANLRQHYYITSAQLSFRLRKNFSPINGGAGMNPSSRPANLRQRYYITSAQLRPRSEKDFASVSTTIYGACDATGRVSDYGQFATSSVNGWR
jgi:hypothetical protein